MASGGQLVIGLCEFLTPVAARSAMLTGKNACPTKGQIPGIRLKAVEAWSPAPLQKTSPLLGIGDDVNAAIFLPAGLVVLVAGGLLLAIAYRGELSGRDTNLY
jgi:hypothetical protein